MNLNELKEASALSNKQWDNGIKGLTKLGVAKVTKSEDNLTVEIID
jgi:lysyl-tRNA synthetase class 2